MPNKEKIKQVLNLQYHYRNTLPNFNYFGENNWTRLDMSIKLLQDALEDIKSTWFDKWFYIDDNDNNDYRQVTDVADWLDGTFDENYFDEELKEEGIQ